jgi:YVTN family beta-propeller protein
MYREILQVRAIIWTLTLFAPASLAFGQQAAFVVGEKVAGSVGFYDSDFKRLGGVKVGSHPHEMSLTPDKRTLYVADNGVVWMTETAPGENTISIVDVPSRRRTGVVDLGEYRRPHGVTFDPSSGHVWVTTEKPAQLLNIDPATRKIVRRYDVKGGAPHIVTLSPGWAFTSNTDTGTMSAINIQSGEVRLIPCGQRPQGQAVSPDRKTLFVANSGESSISIIDVAGKKKIGTIPTGKAPVRLAVTHDGKTLIVALQEGRSVGFADIAGRKEFLQIPLAGRPVSMSLSSDGRLAYCSVQEEDKIYVISVAERKVLAIHEAPKGTGPDPVIPLQ